MWRPTCIFLFTVLTACGPVRARDNAPLINGPAPYRNTTPMSEALTCMRSQLARQEDIRIGIADLVDGTGASLGEGDNAGRMVTQRPDLMLLVAMSRAGARLVNRTSIGVVEWEMREAMARRLGEGREARVGDTTFPFRPVRVGEIVGSSFYVSGAVTEYNYNIYSDVQEAGVFGVTAGRRSYRVSVAVDLVVTRSTTTEVRLARSYGKQLVGQEVGVGVFRFLDMSVGNTRTELFEANIGQRQNEPVQAALRWVIETGAYDILSELFGRSETCDRLVPGYDPGSNAREAGDPRRPSSPAAAPGATPAPASPAAPAPAEILQFEQTAPEQPVAQQSPPAAQQQSRAAPPDAIPPPPAAARTVVAEQVARPSLMSAIARLFAAAPANDAGTAASPAHNGPAASATPPPATATVATATVATATVAAATAATPPPATATASVAPPATPLPATATAAAAARRARHATAAAGRTCHRRDGSCRYAAARHRRRSGSPLGGAGRHSCRRWRGHPGAFRAWRRWRCAAARRYRHDPSEGDRRALRCRLRTACARHLRGSPARRALGPPPLRWPHAGPPARGQRRALPDPHARRQSAGRIAHTAGGAGAGSGRLRRHRTDH